MLLLFLNANVSVFSHINCNIPVSVYYITTKYSIMHYLRIIFADFLSTSIVLFPIHEYIAILLTRNKTSTNSSMNVYNLVSQHKLINKRKQYFPTVILNNFELSFLQTGINKQLSTTNSSHIDFFFFFNSIKLLIKTLH